MHSRFFALSLLAAASVTVVLSGCHVSSHHDGKNNNVDINVPFASMHVKANDNGSVSGIGLMRYPGSVPAKDDNGKHDGADINLNFGDFHLGVKAADFQTADSPDKVQAFYRKNLAQYGDVLACQHDHPVGQPTRTSQGLTCSDDEHHGHINADINSDAGGLELRAGSPTHMHVVGIEPKDGGTKIGLVMLDLPKNLEKDGPSEE